MKKYEAPKATVVEIPAGLSMEM
jgi:hypothetical protein